MANLNRGHQSPLEQVIRIMVLAMEEIRVYVLDEAFDAARLFCTFYVFK